MYYGHISGLDTVSAMVMDTGHSAQFRSPHKIEWGLSTRQSIVGTSHSAVMQIAEIVRVSFMD